MYFKEAGLWSIITEVVPGDCDAEWHKKNNKALRDIFNACESEARELILEDDYAKSAFGLRNSKTVIANTIQYDNRLLDDWDLIKMGNETCEQYVARVKTLSMQLNQVGEGVFKERMLNKLLKGLSKEYASLRSSFKNHEGLTEEKVVDAILAEEGEIAESRREEEKTKVDTSRGGGRERKRQDMPVTSRVWVYLTGMTEH